MNLHVLHVDSNPTDATMKIEIIYDGGTAKCTVNGEPLSKCSKLTLVLLISAFECIKKHIKRENLLTINH